VDCDALEGLLILLKEVYNSTTEGDEHRKQRRHRSLKIRLPQPWNSALHPLTIYPFATTDGTALMCPVVTQLVATTSKCCVRRHR